MNAWPRNMRGWLVEPLPADVQQSLARLASAPDVVRVAVMPDVHLSREVCVGVVLATRGMIYPAAVGNDIGCGMAALRVDAGADLIDEQAAALILAELYRRVPGNRHGRAAEVALPDVLAAGPLSDARLETIKRRDGRVQLGTLGRGNHFLELQADDAGGLWVMVHSGSRAIGQAIAEWHSSPKREQGKETPRNGGLAALDAGSPAGEAYLSDAAWAIDYARASRRAMLAAVERLFVERFGVACHWETYCDAHHNHVQREEHDGELLWVHRKGAQSARDGEAGLIPGSMGTASFHVDGRGQSEALASCSHGAGRRLSRTEAGRLSSRDVERTLAGVWFDQRHARALREEAPAAYKDIHAVMRAQRELVRIVRQLRPLVSYKVT